MARTQEIYRCQLVIQLLTPLLEITKAEEKPEILRRIIQRKLRLKRLVGQKEL